MPRPVRNPGRTSDPRQSGGEGDKQNHFHLLRNSHIFAATVREVMQESLLREVTPLPLSLSQFHLLKLMAFDGGHQLCEVAHFLDVSPPAATKNIDKLEKYGLVTRGPSQGDRRATSISVTFQARQLVERYERLRVERLSSVLNGFSEEELERLSRLLHRLSVSLLRSNHATTSCRLRCAADLVEDCPIGRLFDGCPYAGVLDARAGPGGNLNSRGAASTVPPKSGSDDPSLESSK